jgi:hypothetical protein
MATILDLGKLRFHFAGEYDATTEYELNDVVKYGGNVYVYANVVKTTGNIPTTTAYWTLMIEGFKFRDVYDNATQYRVGDGITHGGKVYICVLDTQGNTPPNATYWSQFADGLQWEGNFDIALAYQKNDLVKYGSQVYIAKQDTTGNLPTQSIYWDKFVEGISAEGVYNAAVAYTPGDLVAYGANIYRCLANSTGNLPTDGNFWDLFSTGNKFRGVWDSTTPYLIGETVRYGGNVYAAKQDNSNRQPDLNPSDWDEFSTGVNSRGAWATAVDYAINDVVSYGGNSYIVLIGHTSGTFATDLGAGKWQKFNSGIRYMGNWTTGTAYVKDDIVKSSVSTYICLIDHTAGADFFIDLNTNNYWSEFVAGASYVLPNTAGNAGKYLQTPDGATYSWQFSGENDKIYYVSEDSTSSADDVNHGAAIDYAFASVRYACDYINADVVNRTPATIFIKDGTYSEVLPIHIPPNTSIVGDGQRNCIIQPAAGNGDNGVPNEEETMFYVNTGTMIEGLNLKGLTGFAINTPGDVTAATIKGVYFRLEPGSTILKSPYIKESSAFSTGGVGAVVDGSVVATGTAGSMVFHTFTQVHDGGIGFWVKDNGLSEIVSCFTYYNDYGYATTGGGKIRALNGNNSYGRYGSISAGYDANEKPVDGFFYGDTITYDATTLNTTDGFTVGDTLTFGGTTTTSGVITSLSNTQQMTLTTQKDATVTGITAANPGVVTATAHGFSTNQSISFAGVVGMTEVNGNSYTITVIDADSFSIDDTSAFTAYTSDGTATLGGPHGLTEGDEIAFKDVTPNAWQQTLGSHGTASMYNRPWYADVVDTTTFRVCSNPDMTNYVDSRSINGWGIVTETITDATRANPVVITMTGHGYSNGQVVQAVTGVVGMTQLNGNDYYANNVTANTVELYSDAGLTTSVDGTGYSAYSSGGTAERVLTGTALTGANFIHFKETKAEIANIQTNIQPATNHRLVINKTRKGYVGRTIKVSVANYGEGNRYVFDGQELGSFQMDTKHRMYTFEQNDATNIGHPLYFSETQDGVHNGGVEFNGTKDAATGLTGQCVEYWLDGVLQSGLNAYETGFATATAREVRVIGAVPSSGKLYSVCKVHPGMGGGTGYTATDATYDPANGVCVLTIGTHPLAVGHNVEIAQDSITMTCDSDSNATNHTYPRSTDPALTKVFVKIIAVSSTTITVNVGASPLANQYVHTFVSAVANSINTSASSKPTIVYNTTTQHSTADTYWERFSGPYYTTSTIANGATITAQDGQFATTASIDANMGQHGFSLVLAGLSEEPRPGSSIEFITGPVYNPTDNVDRANVLNTGADGVSYIVTGVSGYAPSNDPWILGSCVVTIATEKPNTSGTYYGQRFNIRYKYSQTRLTGHDFLSIGTGGRASTNYPGEPTTPAAQGQEVTELYPGRVYFVSTDQDGNFRVGNYFRVDQSTGRATLDASAFDLAGLTSLRLGSIGAQLGESINEFSADGALTGNSNTAVPTEQAVKTYVDNKTTIAIGAANNAVLTKAFDIGNLNRNASGEITGVTHESVTYSNVVYTGENITGYRETSANGTIKDVTVTYSTDGKIATVVTVAGS